MHTDRPPVPARLGDDLVAWSTTASPEGLRKDGTHRDGWEVRVRSDAERYPIRLSAHPARLRAG